MHRKLVTLDEKNGESFSEVDQVRVQREARLVRQIIKRDVPLGDPYGIHSELLPLVDRIIAGEQNLPLTSQFEPGALRWARHEGTLPSNYRQFLRAEASFWVTTTGSHREEPVEESIDGERHAWVDFEDDQSN